MIKKLNRFTNQSVIRKLMSSRSQVRGPGLTLKYISNNQQQFRLAVVVSKKTAKSAVVRNRIRRRVFAWAEDRASELPALDMVVFAHTTEVAQMPKTELDQRLDTLLGKLQS